MTRPVRLTCKPGLLNFLFILSFLASTACASIEPISRDPAAIRLKQILASTDQTKLRATYGGVSTVSLQDESSSLLVDGFFSRPLLGQVLFGNLDSDVGAVSDGLGKMIQRPLSAVLVAQAHHDHAMDSGWIGATTGATVAAAGDTLRLIKAGSPSVRTIELPQNGNTTVFGPFSVSAFQTAHSKPNLAPGIVSTTPPRSLRRRDFVTDSSMVFQIHHLKANVLVVGSVAEMEGRLSEVKADVVFLSVASLERQNGQFLERYWCETVLATGAKVVVPIHWDNFFKPIRGPMQPMLGSFSSFTRAMKALRRLSERDGVGLVVLDAFETIDVSAAAAMQDRSNNWRQTPCSAING